MANGIVSSSTYLSDTNEITVQIVFEYDGSAGSASFIGKIDTSTPSSSSPSLNVDELTPISGTSQYRLVMSKSNLNYNTRYYVSVVMHDNVHNTDIFSYSNNIVTGSNPSQPSIDDIISGNLYISDYVDLTVTVVYRWDGQNGVGIRVIASKNADYSSPINIPYKPNSSQNLGNNEYQEQYFRAGLEYDTLYHIKITMYYTYDQSVINEFVGQIRTLEQPPPRLTASCRVQDKNHAFFDVDVVEQVGDPHMTVEVHYAIGAVNIYSPSANFNTYNFDDPHNYYVFDAPNLKYDETYNYKIYLIDVNDDTRIIDTADGTFQTEKNNSHWTTVTTTPDKRKCKIDGGVYLEVTTDSYRFVVKWSKNPIVSLGAGLPQRDASSVTTVDLNNKIAHFDITGLKTKTKYYFLLILIDVTTDQVLDLYNGDFTTLKDDNPWWMYLRYTL